MTTYTIEIPDSTVDIKKQVNTLFDHIDNTAESTDMLKGMFEGNLPPLYYTGLLHRLDAFDKRLDRLLWFLALECFVKERSNEEQLRFLLGGGLLTASPPLV